MKTMKGDMKCLNPVTHNIKHLKTKITYVLSLQTLCRNIIRQSLTLSRLNQVSVLPLPKGITYALAEISLGDFQIDPGQVTAENYRDKTYPATCLIDQSRVKIQVCPKSMMIPPDPTYISTFLCSDALCHVYHLTKSLDDIIKDARDKKMFLSEYFIWNTLYQISCLSVTTPPTLKLRPGLLHVYGSQIIYKPQLAQDDMAVCFDSPDVAFYEAPEVMKGSSPSLFSQSWTIGCIMYELLALEPAYYDRARTGDMMAVMEAIVEGVLPPPPPLIYSPDIFGLLAASFQADADRRPLPAHVMMISKAKLAKMKSPKQPSRSK